MRKLFISIALLTVIAVVTHQSSGQQPDPALFKLFGPVMRVVGDNPGSLALNPGVQKEIKMDEEQVNAVREKVATAGLGFGFGRGKGKQDEAAQERRAKMMEKIGSLKDVPEDQLEEKIRETFKDEIEGPTKEVEKILKPEQMTRLRQISRQQAGFGQSGGAAAYLKPENVKDLKLTDDQQKKLREIRTELEKDVGELRRGAGGAKGGFGRVPPETQEKIDALVKEAKEKAEGTLTDEQKSKWKELIGEPYTVQFQGGRARPKKDD